MSKHSFLERGAKIMKKTKAEQTADKILDSAVEIFAEKGYSATTTSEIAKKAEVAEGTIFRYFPKKKDLLTKVVYRFLDSFGEKLLISPLERILKDNKNQPVEVIIKEIIKDRVRLFRKYNGYLKVLATEMQFHDEIYDIFKTRILTSGFDFGEHLFQELYDRGEIRDLNTLVTFRTLLGSVVFMMIQRSFLSDISSGLTLDEEIDQIIDILMNGIKRKDTGGDNSE